MCGGEIAACAECVGVVGAEEAGAVGQEGLVHVDGRGEEPRILVCGGEIVACAECVGVVGAEEAGAVG